MVEKKFGYSYAGSGLAALRPMDEAQMLHLIKCSVDNDGCSLEEFQVYELVPVKLVSKTVQTFERVSN